MDFDGDLQTPALVGLAIVVVGVVYFLKRRQDSAWVAGLRAVAQRYRCNVSVNARVPWSSAIIAELEPSGHRLHIRQDLRSSASSDRTTRLLFVEVDPAASGIHLSVHQPRRTAVHEEDYSGKEPPRTGVAAIDEGFVVRHASEQDRRLLQDPEARAGVLAFLQRGGELRSGTLVYEQPRLPREPEELLLHVEPMLALADSLGRAARVS